MKSEFIQELKDSGYIHAPLPLHQEKSLEQENREKPVRKRKTVWNDGQGAPVSRRGIGSLSFEDAGRDGGKIIRIRYPNAFAGEGNEPEYNLDRRAELMFGIEGENWEKYSRISFFVCPQCPGIHAVHFRVHITNEGRIPIPDPYFREGQNLINLVNREWNQVIWEFSALPRDKVTQFRITMDADGLDTSTGPESVFDFENVELQTVETAQKELGWLPETGRISYSYSGYQAAFPKTAVGPGELLSFAVENRAGETVLEKSAEQVQFGRDTMTVLDFSEVTEEGEYRIVGGGLATGYFPIGSKIMESAVWKVINFIFCERCGFPVPGKHGRCHTDVIARHKGAVMSFGGGWHDAGDMSQQMLQTAEVAQELLELSDRIADNAVLSARLREEGLWGLEFTLRTRFGDGYRASSVGLGRWTNGLIGDRDDVETRVHNQAFQNYFCAAVEAQAALSLRETDPELAWKCAQTAKEDYRFARARFQEKGAERPVMWEHTLNSSMAQYYAAAVWACASICSYEPDEEFEKEAKRIARKLLACQETGAAGVPLRGFFYRDQSHRTIVHFTHQGRDHSFVQAVAALLRAFPEAEERGEWENSLRLYGEYIKNIFSMASPYGMMPAGIYHISEAEDDETFPLLHLQADYDREKENYREQVKAGIDLGGGYSLRMFPVWFSFRGNHAIMLGMAKAAALVGRCLNDKALLACAMDQLYWISGRNPFCQSLMYGEGERYAQQDANYPGEMTGELPVGIETRDNGDEPYWPSATNATYKEVWLTPAGRWLSVIAELYPEI